MKSSHYSKISKIGVVKLLLFFISIVQEQISKVVMKIIKGELENC